VVIEYANFISIINSLNILKKILAKTKLDIVIEYKEEGYYIIKDFKIININKYNISYKPYSFNNNSLIIDLSRPINIPKITTKNSIHIYNLELELIY
jgi:hypothetical protein